MGEAIYSLKAQFKTKREAAIACRDLNIFFGENNTANDILKEPTDAPALVKEYLQIIKGSWSDIQYYGEGQAYYFHNVLIYCAEVGHLGSWNNLQTFITEKYKPIRCVWGSDEYGGSLDALQLYAWEEIVQAILKHKKTLPFLLGIHKDFDELISIALRKKGKT
jgi:hypothetical protein